MSKKTYYITFCALFAAVGVALNLLSSAMPRVDTFGRISLVYAFCFLAGIMLGPYLGGATAALADFLPAIIFPEGPWMPLITLSNGVMAMLAGLLYKKINSDKISVKLTMIAICSFVFCTLGLTAAGESLLYNMGMQAYYPTTTMLVNAGLPLYLANVVRKACTQWFWLLLNTLLTFFILKSGSLVKYFNRKKAQMQRAEGNASANATVKKNK